MPNLWHAAQPPYFIHTLCDCTISSCRRSQKQLLKKDSLSISQASGMQVSIVKPSMQRLNTMILELSKGIAQNNILRVFMKAFFRNHREQQAKVRYISTCLLLMQELVIRWMAGPKRPRYPQIWQLH